MKKRKGIILAGGSGSRLSPLTRGASKQLLPVYDKPMIYYPLSVLMLTGIREILIISTPHDVPILEKILGDGSECGVDLFYAEQPTADGVAQAFLIAEDFLDDAPAALVLGDNLLFGQDLTQLLAGVDARKVVATVFGYRVKNPSAFGVVELDNNRRVISIEEKPSNPRSQYAVPGLFFYDGRVCKLARTLKPSPRGEVEITDLNRLYLEQGNLHTALLGRGCAWLDMGTHEYLHRAAVYVESIQGTQGYQIANLEEIALRRGWMSPEILKRNIAQHGQSSYSRYLNEILVEPGHLNLNILVK